MSYQAYLFDFDYTLADSSRGIVMCFRNVLERHGYADVTDDATWNEYVASIEAQNAQNVVDMFNQYYQNSKTAAE